MTLNDRIKYIFIAATVIALVLSAILNYTYTEEISFLSWDFAIVSINYFLMAFSTILTIAITAVGMFIPIKILFETDFIDDWLLFKVREYKTVWLWIVLIFLLIFCSTTLLVLIRPLFTGVAEWKWVSNHGLTLLFTGEGFLIGLMIVVLAKLKEPPKLSSALADAIEEKLIVRYPNSAVLKAFTFFEHRLRQKINFKGVGVDLINQAYGDKELLKHEQSEANRDLMKGMFSTYRNPMSHNQKEFDKQTCFMILIQIDHFVTVIDESELKVIEDSENPSKD